MRLSLRAFLVVVTCIWRAEANSAQSCPQLAARVDVLERELGMLKQRFERFLPPRADAHMPGASAADTQPVLNTSNSASLEPGVQQVTDVSRHLLATDSVSLSLLNDNAQLTFGNAEDCRMYRIGAGQIGIAGSLSVETSLSANSISSATTVSATGQVSGGSVKATGQVTGGSLSVTGAASLSGTTSLGATTLASATVTGTTNLAATTIASLTVSGTSNLGATTIASVTVPGTSNLGATTIGSVTVSGTSNLAATTIASATVTGTSNLGSTTIASVTVSGTSNLGATTIASATVTGATTLAATTIASATVTGATTLAATTISGITRVNNQLFGASRSTAGGAQRICTGQAPVSDWTLYDANSIYIDASIALCGFTNPPMIFTSIQGNSQHWKTLGPTNIYSLTNVGFRVYAYNANDSPLTTAFMTTQSVRLNWLAIGT